MQAPPLSPETSPRPTIQLCPWGQVCPVCGQLLKSKVTSSFISFFGLTNCAKPINIQLTKMLKRRTATGEAVIRKYLAFYAEKITSTVNDMQDYYTIITHCYLSSRAALCDS